MVFALGLLSQFVEESKGYDKKILGTNNITPAYRRQASTKRAFSPSPLGNFTF